FALQTPSAIGEQRATIALEGQVSTSMPRNFTSCVGMSVRRHVAMVAHITYFLQKSIERRKREGGFRTVWSRSMYGDFLQGIGRRGDLAFRQLNLSRSSQVMH